MALNETLLDSALELHSDLLRLDASKRRQIIALLKRVEGELLTQLVADTAINPDRTALLMRAANDIINQAYRESADIMRDTLLGVADVSAQVSSGALSISLGGQLTAQGIAAAVLPSTQMLAELVSNSITQGALQQDWWQRQSVDTAWRFKMSVQQGIVAGESNQQIINRVRGIMAVSYRNAEALVRTSVQTVANDTREHIFEQHDDVISSKEWNAALDLRTCPTCGIRDGKRWKTDGTPIGHKIPYSKPPKHFSCRCTTVPILKTWRELGINIDEMPAGTRASMEGQVNDKTFKDWIERKLKTNPNFANEQFGKGRVELWRSGKITFEQLFDLRGNPLTLAELKNKYRIA